MDLNRLSCATPREICTARCKRILDDECCEITISTIWVRAGNICYNRSRKEQRQLHQHLGQDIDLVKERAPSKNQAKHYEEERLEFSERKEWDKEGQNSRNRKVKELVDRKRVLAVMVEGRYNQEEHEMVDAKGRVTHEMGATEDS